MLIRNCILAAALLWTTAVFAQSAAQSAHADIVNAQGQKIGTATILQADHGVRIDVQVSQLSPGSHGIHVHSVGKCEGPAFTSAGAHLNPTAKKHGKDNPEGPHAGDLLNIQVQASPAAGSKPLNVLMVGTGEYTTGFVGGGASGSDKKVGVVGLTLFDLRRRGKVGKLSMVGTTGSKFPAIRN